MDMNSVAALAHIAKRGASMQQLAEHVCKFGSCDQTESSWTDLMLAYATDHRCDGETPEQSFSRIFCADNPLGKALRRAHEICKGAAVTGRDAMRADSTHSDEQDFESEERAESEEDDELAYDKLVELSRKAAAADPTKSEHQHFAALYS
jgi:hypothetical protein